MIPEESKKPGKEGNLDILNSLRAVAALMVCLYHAAFVLSNDFPSITHALDIGQEGVYVFFVISGMVMPLSLDKMKFTWSRWGSFMAKRIVRLQPPLILSAAVMTVVTYGILQAKGLNTWAVFLGSATLTSPFFGIPWANDIYWTLFVEMQYYLYIALLFPLLISNRVLVRWTVILVALAATLLTQLESWYWMKLTLPFHIPVFMMGYFLYMIHKKKIEWWEFAAGIVLSAITCAYVTGHLLGLGYRIVGVAMVTVLLIHLLSKGWRWLSALGEYSYSLYLIHWSIIGLFYNYVGPWLPGTWGTVMLFVAIISCSVLASIGFYYIIEKPSLRWAKKIAA